MVRAGALSPGTHACCRFRDTAEKRAVVGGFAADGLSRGERVALYARGGDASALLGDAFSEHEVARLTRSGQLLLESADEAYFGDGGFDGPALASQFASFAATSVAEGYAGLRVFADNGWMPAAVGDPAAWLEYELRIGLMVPQHRLIGLCGFDAEEDDGALSATVLDAVHAASLGGSGAAQSSFRVEGDGSCLALHGEIDFFSRDDLLQVLEAARPLLVGGELSLAGVTFADAGAAIALFEFVQGANVTVRDLSPVLRKVWRVLGLAADTP